MKEKKKILFLWMYKMLQIYLEWLWIEQNGEKYKNEKSLNFCKIKLKNKNKMNN